MKTRTKLVFIDQNGSLLTIYPFKPIDGCIKSFRKEQFDKIDKDDRIYCALARETGKWHETHYLDENMIANLSDDTFSGKKIGYENPYNPLTFDQFEYWCGDPKHVLKRTDGSTSFDAKVASYLNGDYNRVPFRVSARDKDGVMIHNFLPISGYVGPFDGCSYATMRGILHLSDLAYLEQLLRCNSVGILANRAAQIDGSLETILDLFSFSSPITLNIDVIKESEEMINSSHKLLYGDKTFHREVPLNPEQTEKERRPISQDLLEQAEIDKPIIKQLKNYLYK